MCDDKPLRIPNAKRGSNGPLVYRITRTAARLLLHALYRIEIEGVGHLPRSGAFALLPKHQRWQDVPLIGLATPKYLYYVAKHELFTNPLNRWFIGSLGGIPLNRERPIASRQTLHAIRRYLDRNQGLVVFPEGTYYPGTVGPGNPGILRFIVKAAKVPLIPVGIHYSRRPIRSVVRIRFGTPIHPGQSMGADDLLTRIMERIAALSGMSR